MRIRGWTAWQDLQFLTSPCPSNVALRLLSVELSCGLLRPSYRVWLFNRFAANANVGRIESLLGHVRHHPPGNSGVHGGHAQHFSSRNCSFNGNHAFHCLTLAPYLFFFASSSKFLLIAIFSLHLQLVARLVVTYKSGGHLTLHGSCSVKVFSELCMTSWELRLEPWASI